MKAIKNIFIACCCIAISCTDGYIDEITPVEQGTDAEAPEVVITSPVDGALIRVVEDVTSITVDLEVTDDIEIQTVLVELDGEEIASFDTFPDYRRGLKQFEYGEVTNGPHTLTVTATDVSGKSTTESVSFEKIEPYQPQYDGEVFYVPFDGDYMELVAIQQADVNGSPGFAEGISGQAYAGASNAYLIYDAERLHNEEFSAMFWYKVNPDPDRAGLLVMGPPDPANPDAMNNRTKGFRLFREAAGGMQRIKLNVGTGDGESWFDGGAAADLNPADDAWAHIAFTISPTEGTVFINGEVVSQGTFPGIDWEGTDLLSVGSGAPSFTGWGHLATSSLIDELRIFHKTLTQEEINAIREASLR
nr:LamG domain-containing protein [Cytophagales bacterium]